MPAIERKSGSRQDDEKIKRILDSLEPSIESRKRVISEGDTRALGGVSLGTIRPDHYSTVKPSGAHQGEVHPKEEPDENDFMYPIETRL